MSKDKEIQKLKDRIQALEEENQCLNYVINRLPVSIYWKDKQGIYLGCNQYVTEMAGVASKKDILGKTDAQLPWSQYAEEFEEIDARIIREHVTEKIEETAVLDDGDKHYFLTTKGPLCNEQDQVIGVLGVSVDITERVQAQQALVIAKEKAEVANKAKEEFLYNMRHDMRTPFSGIMGMAMLLRSMEEDEEKLRYINNIYISSEELLDHFNTILEFTQSDIGSLPVIASQLDIKESLQSCINMFMPSIEIKKIRLCLDYDSQLAPAYLSDDFRLKRIVMNLLGNAVKFTDDGGQIYVSAQLLKQDEFQKKAVIRIQVKDNGIGIPADKQDIIFEKFERLTSSYKGKYKGTGLGLYSVKTLVQDFQGKVHVESELGKGAAFICDIPMGISDKLISETQTLARKSNLCLASSPDLLLVEDSPIIQLAAITLLENLHCFVDTVDSGEKAVKHCQEKAYDLILMDIGLPGIDGFEATNKIRQLADGKLVPIIALTAHATHEIDEQCHKVGINQVVSKPLTQDKVISLLNQFTAKEHELEITSNHIVPIQEGYTKTDSKVIDIKDSMSKRGSIEEVQKYCFLLKDNLASSLSTLSLLLKDNNRVALAKETHKLKGVLSLVTLPALQQAVENFSDHLKNQDSETIDLVFLAVENENQRFLKELKSL